MKLRLTTAADRIPEDVQTEIYVKASNGNLELVGMAGRKNLSRILEGVSQVPEIKAPIKKECSVVLSLKLKEILAERGMEQKELAELTGLTSRTISELCNNKSKRYPRVRWRRLWRR